MGFSKFFNYFVPSSNIYPKIDPIFFATLQFDALRNLELFVQYGCFSRFLNCINVAISRKASHLQTSNMLHRHLFHDVLQDFWAK